MVSPATVHELAVVGQNGYVVVAMTHPAADTKSIVCVRQPDGGMRFYVNGLMLPVVYAAEEYGHREGHIVTLKLMADCIDFQPRRAEAA